MSRRDTVDPAERAGPCAEVETVVVPRTADVGGLAVRRALPSAQRRMVGPFVFLDEMGPGSFPAGGGLDVRPHPHIGLATVTYLLDGELMHRDSLGTEIAITPGALNWMTAGQGIVHSERTPAGVRRGESQLSGVQAWVALPRAQEDVAPAFAHVAANDLPVLDAEGKRLRLVAGSLFGLRSPVATATDTLYADVSLDADARFPVPVDTEERAAYLLSGTVEVAGQPFEPGRLLLFRPGDAITMTARTPARFMLLGGEVMDGPRFLWWNFVASSEERIEQAKARWRTGGFPQMSNDSDPLPLPEQRRGPT